MPHYRGIGHTCQAITLYSRTTKAAPARARALKKQKLTVPEIAKALGVKQRTVYHYLRRRVITK